MNRYTLTLTHEEAEALGFALKRAIRDLDRTKASDDAEGETYWQGFRGALRDNSNARRAVREAYYRETLVSI